MTALLDRLRAETSNGNRELDGMIEAAMLPQRADGWKPWPTKGGYVLTPTGEAPRPGWGQFITADYYTSSLDAALALVERKLPGWWWTLDTLPHTDGGRLYMADLTAPSSEWWSGAGPTPALALLIALLSALEAGKETT